MKFKSKFTTLIITAMLVPVVAGCAVILIFDRIRYMQVKEEYHIDLPYNSYPVLIGMAVFVISCIVASLIIHRKWIRPINRLNDAISRASEGDLNFTVETEGGGEMSEMLNNFEVMRVRLKESLDDRLLYEKDNRELISNISHDLKTPITAIKGYVEGIMDGVADSPEKMDKYIRTIYNKANDMDHLINELTVYSQIDMNRIPYNFHRLNVCEYFNDCADELKDELESKGIEFAYDNNVPPEVLIIGDPEQLRRVINNIVGNSIKYIGHENGHVSLKVEDISDSIRIELSDDGKGIPAADLPNIFDRFYRADASRNSSQGGSGIGLSIVKKIVEDHGGYIWAHSNENEGTTMNIVLKKYTDVDRRGNDEQNIDN